MILANNIEKANECDSQALLSLQKAAFMEVAKQMNNYNIPPLLQDIQDIRNDFDICIILKYVSDNQIVGSIRGNIYDDHICHVGKLIVHPDFQNRGIGKALMCEIEKYFPACQKFTLFTGEETPNTLHLYTKVGYHVVYKKEIDGINLIHMEKENNGKTKPMQEIKIYPIITNKKQYLELLLLADEQESMIDRYLERGDMFILEDNGVKAVCVVTDEGNRICELKNIAVAPASQRQGYGKKLINYLINYYSGKYTQMIVGTGDVPSAIGFYQNCGFGYSHRIENFFIDNYDHLMIEEGVLLKDMVYLKQNITEEFTIRTAQQSDVIELRDLYKNTVLEVNSRDYSQEEVEDWASCGDDLSNIGKMIESHYFIVAVNQLSQIVGFSSITPQGYLHSMFIHKDFQGKGIATLLLKEIERYSIAEGIKRITSEVSITARPFFEKHGYTVEAEQKRRANQLCLTNFWMAKSLVNFKPYNGRIPACGVFCGGCPTYMRENSPCKGAELNCSRCAKCKTFHLCCLEKGITHCFQCCSFPCTKFKAFTKRWLKHGQDFIENQLLLKRVGEDEFLRIYNKKI